MAAPLPGAAYLSSMARLEQHRNTPALVAAHTTMTFDTLLPCKNNPAISPIICSARYIAPTSTPIVEEGIYHIFIKLVVYQPNLHVASPVREDNDFTFLGQIVSLRRLDLPFDFDLLQSDIPSIFIITGNVMQVDTLDIMFTTSLIQNTAEDLPVGTIIIRTVTFAHSLWPNNPLPAVNERIAFSGKLLSMEGHKPILLVDQIDNALNGQPPNPPA
ncbi:hypothetical protein V8E53_004871 [Lactarius tabidus]